MDPQQDANLRRRAQGRGTAQTRDEGKFRPPENQNLKQNAERRMMAEAWHGPVADGKSLLGEGGRGLLNIPKARATGECEGRHQGQCLTGGKGRNSNPRLEGSGPATVQAGGRGHVLFQRWILLIARMKTEEMTRVKYSGGGKKRGERCWSKK